MMPEPKVIASVLALIIISSCSGHVAAPDGEAAIHTYNNTFSLITFYLKVFIKDT
jgi:hypothetical protein